MHDAQTWKYSLSKKWQFLWTMFLWHREWSAMTIPPLLFSNTGYATGCECSEINYSTKLQSKQFSREFNHLKLWNIKYKEYKFPKINESPQFPSISQCWKNFLPSSVSISPLHQASSLCRRSPLCGKDLCHHPIGLSLL